MQPRFVFAHSPRSTFTIYVDLCQPAAEELSAYGHWSILRADFHNDYKDIVHASTIRAASKRPPTTVTVDQSRLRISPTASRGLQGPQEQTHWTSSCIIDDFVG